MTTVVERGEPAFDTLLPNLRSALAHRIRAIVTIAVTKLLLLTLPAYDEGKTEPELRRAWTTRFRMLQPFERSRSNQPRTAALHESGSGTFENMPTGGDSVRFRGKTGSPWRHVRLTQLDPKGT
jgi:hypothetical protein